MSKVYSESTAAAGGLGLCGIPENFFAALAQDRLSAELR